ncbi:MAG TPA: enoyl-CoA hydratase-related protein [Chitinophagaceae bacterium]|nr:enoyl-CoA hydratase-related protein [Chitinophagaceae bacterium]
MSSILFQTDSNTAIITLNRPDKLNALNREMALLFQQQLDESASRPDVRCVYITGAGKGFCAGQDLSDALGADGRPETTGMLREYYNPIIDRIRKLPKPVIAAVNGTAAGAGASLALCCDIVLATQSASFIQAFSKIGLIPDCGGTWFLPRLVGWQRALAYSMLAEKISAGEAERIGMIYKAIPDEAFASVSLELAKKIAQMPTKGLSLIKYALNQSFSNSYEQQLALEDQLQQEAGQTADAAEGVKAFLQKRAPVFAGK